MSLFVLQSIYAKQKKKKTFFIVVEQNMTDILLKKSNTAPFSPQSDHQ